VETIISREAGKLGLLMLSGGEPTVVLKFTSKWMG
jgi:hypothetical protein